MQTIWHRPNTLQMDQDFYGAEKSKTKQIKNSFHCCSAIYQLAYIYIYIYVSYSRNVPENSIGSCGIMEMRFLNSSN